MAKAIGSLLWKSKPVLANFWTAMEALHPRIGPKEHLDVLKVIGDLAPSGSTTTVSKVVEEMGNRGFTLSKGQIRSRIKDLEKEEYLTMEYPPGKPRLFFVHTTLGIVRWKQLMQLLKELKSYLRSHGNASASVRSEMERLEKMRSSGDFRGFIQVYNFIALNLGFSIIEIRGLAKRIELTNDGWDVYYA
jgi:DNA-binding PadR family transcriptional regulator